MRRLVVLLLALSGLPFAIGAEYNAFAVCPGLVDDAARLACYDSFAPAANESEVAETLDAASLQRVILSQVQQEPLFGYGVDGLTNHEANKLMARTDANDINSLYMDATISVKHPVLNPALDAIADLFEIDETRNLPRLYLAFTTRFSQYLGSRQSAPVVARRYNPELFLRVWRDGAYERGDPAYWDFGYGHESNGQQIEDEEGLLRAQDSLRDNGDSEIFARDYISRGWDYLSLDWHKQWNNGFLELPGRTETHIEYRHYLSDGLFQGRPEEYNSWEGDGLAEKPRDEFSGLQFSLLYTLPTVECVSIVCFEKVQLTQNTGYATPFKHNTTTLEVTTDIAGLPLHLWARTGYNSDLVDYYDYTNSWGFGVEFNR